MKRQKDHEFRKDLRNKAEQEYIESRKDVLPWSYQAMVDKFYSDVIAALKRMSPRARCKDNASEEEAKRMAAEIEAKNKEK